MRIPNLILILSLLLLFSCRDSTTFTVKNFNPFTNYSPVNDTLNLDMDLSDVIKSGVTIPAKNILCSLL